MDVTMSFCIFYMHDILYRIRQILAKRNLYPKIPPRPLFVRGMDLMDSFLFIGVSPASILQIDIQKNKLTDIYTFSNDVNVCVHGIKIFDR